RLAAALAAGAGRLVLAGRPRPGTVAVATALAAPSVAASALVAERAGHRLFGFDLDVLSLTVAHFHYAGFAAALVAALVCDVDGDRPAGRLAALSVPAGVAVVFVGFFTSEWVELAGAAVLTAGMWLVGWLSLRQARAGAARRGLLATSALTLAATMVLALAWALGQAAGLPHPPISWMVATHGLANALGFALCALIAWQRTAAIPRTAAPQRTGAGSQWL
ncbi:YndJ family transporter, partial [Phytohabitans suffuscus]